MLQEELRDDDFANPPKLQYFFLRPWAVMEYVDKADDGSQFKAALSFEWIGINKWDGCFKNIACGASVVSTYSDRAGVDDFGLGLMFHIDNKYSFGGTVRDGEYGFFVTVDLLKAFYDKSAEAKGWQDKVDQYWPSSKPL